MANQSIIAVPPNVENPTVLRRFLEKLVEAVDSSYGYRAGDATSFVDQEKLVEEANKLTAQLQSAADQLEEAGADLSTDFSDTIADINDEIDTLTNRIAAAEDYTAIKGFVLEFTVDASNNVVMSLDYNIDTGTDLSTGIYQFTLDQSTFFGSDVLDNCVFATEHIIAGTASSDLYDLEIHRVSATTFQVKVYEFTVSGSKPSKALTDIQEDDIIQVVGVFNKPGSALPDA